MIDLSAIDAGLKNGEFFLEYLPIISLDRQSWIGAEALIRWQRSSGVVPPLDFIPIVEETPLSGLITYWVIETAAEELGDVLRAVKDFSLSINIPPEILGRGGLAYAMKKSGLYEVASQIILEITERGIPDGIGLNGLKLAYDTGARIALDDVWIDNVNPAILCRTTADILKIDKSFLDEMLLEDWSPTKIDGLENLVRTTDIEVIAEGVESEIQIEILQSAGIDKAQGWLFSPSLPAEEFKEYYHENRER